MADNNITYKITVDAESGTAVVRDLKGQIVATKIPVQELRKEFGNFATTVNSTQFNKFNKGLKDVIGNSKKGLTGTSMAAGASTSATLELGRVLSDMPYGIRGVANNLQQLASNLFFMSKATDAATGKSVGFGGALKNLLGGLIGPAGLLIAFQGIIALFDYFSTGAKKAEESNDDLLQSIGDLVDIQQVSNDKIEEYLVLQKLRQELDSNKEKSNERLKEIEEELFIVEGKRASANRLIAANQKKYDEDRDKQSTRAKGYLEGVTKNTEVLIGLTEDENKLNKEKTEITSQYLIKLKEYRDGRKKLTAADADSLKGLKEEKKVLEERRELLSKTSEDYKRLSKEINRVNKEIEAIEGKKGSGTSKKLSFFKTPKELDIDIKNGESAILRYEKLIKESELRTEMNNSLSAAKTEEERLRIKKLYDIKALTAKIEYEKKVLELSKKTEEEVAKAKAASHSADLRRAFELYKLKIDLDKDLSDEQKEQLKSDAGGKFFDALKQANIEENKSLEEITNKYKKIFKVFGELKAARFQALFSKPDKEKEETDLEKWARYAEGVKEIISGISGFADMEFDRQLTIEQNKTTALNNELNKRLLNENLSKEQKEAIQLQIAQNDEKLRLKQEQIARKKFKVMKAFNLATALADTYLSTQKAYLSQLQLDPTSPIRAKIAAGVALAAGLANVAAIARTRFESSSGTSPAIAAGSSGGGSARAEPSFNIVGRSSDNLILNAIQSQFDQPLRAYVVARDVTNQQQLDGVIASGAST